jgi:hypothetical protein
VKRRVALLVAAALATASQAAAAEPVHSLEVSLLVATSYTFADVAYPTQALIDRKVGMGGSLSIAYKTPYVLFPFLDVSYFDLARASVPALGLDGAPLVHDALAGWFAYAGAGSDLGPLRLKLGLGFDVLQRTSEAGGLRNAVSSLDLGAVLAPSLRLVRRSRFATSLEGRYYYSPASGNSFMALGLSIQVEPIVF